MDFSHGFGLILLITGQCLLITVAVLLSLAFLMFADRKIWAAVQMRKAPMLWVFLVFSSLLQIF